MGKIVAAMATVHAPQLFDRPPSEDPKQLDADVAAMRLIGQDLKLIIRPFAGGIAYDEVLGFYNCARCL